MPLIYCYTLCITDSVPCKKILLQVIACHLTCRQNFTWEYANPGCVSFDPDFDKAVDFDNAAIIQDNNQGVLTYVPKMHTT